MIQFNREYRLQIGDAQAGDGFVITDLEVKFHIKKVVNNKDEDDKCKLFIYNLSEDKLALLEVDYPVAIFSCGYQGNVLQIFQGDVIEVKTEKKGPDRVTRIEVSPNYTELNHKLMSDIVPENGTVEDAIEVIRRNTSLKRGTYKGSQLDDRIVYGYPLVGNPRQMLDQVCEVYKLDWRIEGKALFINSVDTVDTNIKEQAPVVSETTGLIDAPYFFTGNESKSKDDSDKRSGVRFKALINPSVVPGSLVKVEYKGEENYYRVDEVQYRGDFRGNSWEMECLCYTRRRQA